MKKLLEYEERIKLLLENGIIDKENEVFFPKKEDNYVKLDNFFFSSRRRHTISKRDWSSDVCSSDL